MAKGKKSDDVAKLYDAVAKYVKNRGGKLLVIGGIQIQEWPQEPAFCFHVSVKCMGQKPSFAESVANRSKPTSAI